MLIINENHSVTALLKSYLVSKKCNVTISHTNTEFLLAINSNRYSSIITDILLVGTSGLELINTIKNNSTKSKVFVLSHMDQQVQKEMISELGAISFLTFPIDLGYLNSVIE